MGWRANRWNQDRLQIYYSRPLTLANLVGAESGGTSQFRVRSPDSRLRMKVSIYFSPTPGGATYPPNIAGTATLWMADREQDEGLSDGAMAPCTNIMRNPSTGAVITRGAPLSIPTDAGLVGYSQELVTSGDETFGELVVTVPAVNGMWMLGARWQPDGQRLSEEEWVLVKSACQAEVLLGVNV
jgi:hypothetical protein